jgi:hypothetical protein
VAFQNALNKNKRLVESDLNMDEIPIFRIESPNTVCRTASDIISMDVILASSKIEDSVHREASVNNILALKKEDSLTNLTLIDASADKKIIDVPIDAAVIDVLVPTISEKEESKAEEILNKEPLIINEELAVDIPTDIPNVLTDIPVIDILATDVSNDSTSDAPVIDTPAIDIPVTEIPVEIPVADTLITGITTSDISNDELNSNIPVIEINLEGIVSESSINISTQIPQYTHEMNSQLIPEDLLKESIDQGSTEIDVEDRSAGVDVDVDRDTHNDVKIVDENDKIENIKNTNIVNDDHIKSNLDSSNVVEISLNINFAAINDVRIEVDTKCDAENGMHDIKNDFQNDKDKDVNIEVVNDVNISRKLDSYIVEDRSTDVRSDVERRITKDIGNNVEQDGRNIKFSNEVHIEHNLDINDDVKNNYGKNMETNLDSSTTGDNSVDIKSGVDAMIHDDVVNDAEDNMDKDVLYIEAENGVHIESNLDSITRSMTKAVGVAMAVAKIRKNFEAYISHDYVDKVIAHTVGKVIHDGINRILVSQDKETVCGNNLKHVAENATQVIINDEQVEVVINAVVGDVHIPADSVLISSNKIDDVEDNKCANDLLIERIGITEVTIKDSSDHIDINNSFDEKSNNIEILDVTENDGDGKVGNGEDVNDIHLPDGSVGNTSVAAGVINEHNDDKIPDVGKESTNLVEGIIYYDDIVNDVWMSHDAGIGAGLDLKHEVENAPQELLNDEQIEATIIPAVTNDTVADNEEDHPDEDVPADSVLTSSNKIVDDHVVNTESADDLLIECIDGGNVEMSIIDSSVDVYSNVTEKIINNGDLNIDKNAIDKGVENIEVVNDIHIMSKSDSIIESYSLPLPVVQDLDEGRIAEIEAAQTITDNYAQPITGPAVAHETAVNEAILSRRVDKNIIIEESSLDSIVKTLASEVIRKILDLNQYPKTNINNSNTLVGIQNVPDNINKSFIDTPLNVDIVPSPNDNPDTISDEQGQELASNNPSKAIVLNDHNISIIVRTISNELENHFNDNNDKLPPSLHHHRFESFR